MKYICRLLIHVLGFNLLYQIYFGIMYDEKHQLFENREIDESSFLVVQGKENKTYQVRMCGW